MYLFFIITLLGITFYSAFAISCEVYPSEYAYRDVTVTRTESASANCRRYPIMQGLRVGIDPTKYIHCDGTQLKLTDANLGTEHFSTGSHYQWTTGDADQLLFLFPTRVSLTAITLHYYSDSVRGLPRLRFYAVPNDFNVWDVPLTSTPHVDVDSVPPVRGSAGHRNVRINTNFNTNKVLMYKYRSSMFAVSEIEFFSMSCIITSNPTPTPDETMPSVFSLITYTTTTSTIDSAARMTANNTSTKTDISQATTVKLSQKRDSRSANLIAVGVVGTLLLVAITSLIVILSLILWHHKRRGYKSEIDHNSESLRKDASYSVIERGTRQQIRPQGSNSTELYDQIHLSPSTGQTELISKPESETTEDINMSTPNVYSSVDAEDFQPVSNSEESNVENATYAIVNKNKKKKKSKEVSTDNRNKMEKIKEEVEVQGQPSLEDMYAVVHKKLKKSEEQGETPPPIPASTVESLYTAVQKIPQ